MSKDSRQPSQCFSFQDSHAYPKRLILGARKEKETSQITSAGHVSKRVSRDISDADDDEEDRTATRRDHDMTAAAARNKL